MNKPFITVYKSVSGWKAVYFDWSEVEGLGGFYEPYSTGLGAYDTREGAWEEAKQWAESEGVRLAQNPSPTGEV